MNAYVSRLLEERAGRHGVVELEDSLSIQNGDDGDRYIQLPVGTTAQRPANPEPGYLRFNSTLGTAEYWDGTQWRPFNQTLAETLTLANLNANNVITSRSEIRPSGNQVAVGDHLHENIELVQVDVIITPPPFSVIQGRAEARTANGNEPRYRWGVNTPFFPRKTYDSPTFGVGVGGTTSSINVSFRVDDQVNPAITRFRQFSNHNLRRTITYSLI